MKNVHNIALMALSRIAKDSPSLRLAMTDWAGGKVGGKLETLKINRTLIKKARPTKRNSVPTPNELIIMPPSKGPNIEATWNDIICPAAALSKHFVQPSQTLVCF